MHLRLQTLDKFVAARILASQVLSLAPAFYGRTIIERSSTHYKKIGFIVLSERCLPLKLYPVFQEGWNFGPSAIQVGPFASACQLRSTLRKLRVIRIIMADRPFADALLDAAAVIHTCAASNSPSLKFGANNADSAK
jgi:hypothetical protein